MSKSKRRFVFWGILLVLVAALFLLPSPRKIGVENETAPPGIPVASTTAIHEDRGNPPYSLDIQYPQLNGLAGRNIQTAVNTDIQNQVNSAIADLARNNQPGPPDLANVKSSLTIRSDTAYLNTAVFSMEMNFSSYILGAAHPDNYVLTSTYDLRTGKKVSLGDLFLPNSNYLQTISAYAIPALEKDLQADSQNAEALNWIQTGAAPLSTNYDKFLLGKNGLTVIFDPYQVAPYAAGVRRVTVPYALLEKIMDPASVLGARLTAG